MTFVGNDLEKFGFLKYLGSSYSGSLVKAEDVSFPTYINFLNLSSFDYRKPRYDYRQASIRLQGLDIDATLVRISHNLSNIVCFVCRNIKDGATHLTQWAISCQTLADQSDKPLALVIVPFKSRKKQRGMDIKTRFFTACQIKMENFKEQFHDIEIMAIAPRIDKFPKELLELMTMMRRKREFHKHLWNIHVYQQIQMNTVKHFALGLLSSPRCPALFLSDVDNLHLSLNRFWPDFLKSAPSHELEKTLDILGASLALRAVKYPHCKSNASLARFKANNSSIRRRGVIYGSILFLL